jgi:hypothetical protein
VPWDEEIDLPEVLDGADGPLRFTLERCHQRAPYRWRWTGTVVLPEGVEEADVVLLLQVGQGDEGRGLGVLCDR